jgi:hypothetical protein
MATAGKISGLVIQALRHLGQRHVDGDVLATLRQRLKPADKRQLLKDFHFASSWIARFMQQVAETPKK